MFDFECGEAEFLGMAELMELSARESAESEAREELEQLANDLEQGGFDEELVESLRFTASQNPLSETAFDLREESFIALR